MTNFEKFISDCEKLGWIVDTSWDDGTVELRYPAGSGHEYSVYVTEETFEHDVYEASSNFDTDEYIEEYISSGVSATVLLRDATEIEDALKELDAAVVDRSESASKYSAADNWKRIVKIKELLDELLETEPSDEELDYDEDKIRVYEDMHNLKESIENIGY